MQQRSRKAFAVRDETTGSFLANAPSLVDRLSPEIRTALSFSYRYLFSGNLFNESFHLLRKFKVKKFIH